MFVSLPDRHDGLDDTTDEWCLTPFVRADVGCFGGGCPAAPVTLKLVDVRIGVTQAPREITIEVEDSTRDEVKANVEAALAGATDVLWVADKRGRDIGISAAKIAYVEIGSAEGERRIGFGG